MKLFNQLFSRLFDREVVFQSPVVIRRNLFAFRVLLKIDGNERIEEFGMMTERQALARVQKIGLSFMSWHDLDMTTTLEVWNEGARRWEFVDDGYVVPSYTLKFVSNRSVVGK